MGISKIKSVVKTDKTWQGQSGTMYDYVVSLDDGSVGTASSTSPESPPYGEGDEVEYTKSENQFGTKLRIKKAGGNFGGGGFKQNPETQKRIENSWAIQTAVQIIGHQQVELEDYLTQVRELARTLLNERDSLA